MNQSVDALQSINFWRQLCPGLSISESALAAGADSQRPALDSQRWQVCQQTILEDGYFAYHDWFAVDWMDRLADCFKRLEQAQLHPVFGFAYDEFWQILLQLGPMFGDLLGEFDFLPAVWGWYVRPENQTAFPPHRDQVREVFIEDEDHLDYLTVWIPLTDLNHLSSSMCVLPASVDPDYEECTTDIRVENLQDVRNLQGNRGSVFCWTTQLAHWGTLQSPHGQPRMSVGYYLKRSRAPNLEDGRPLNFHQPLTLVDRLAIIGQQIIDYSRTAGDAELEIANRLIGLRK